jgi:NADPH:quinone reductase-like Zn-dependent oxidoreductase
MSSKITRLLPAAVVSAAAVCALAVWWAFSSSESLFTPTPGSLHGKTIVITGGTTGLGLESAKRLAIGGAEIVITSRSNAKGQAAVKDMSTTSESVWSKTRPKLAGSVRVPRPIVVSTSPGLIGCLRREIDPQRERS